MFYIFYGYDNWSGVKEYASEKDVVTFIAAFDKSLNLYVKNVENVFFRVIEGTERTLVEKESIKEYELI